MGLNIEEVSGESVATSGGGTDGWTFTVDLSSPGVTVVSGDFDVVSGVGGGTFAFGGLSTTDFGTLSGNATDGTFTFTIDRDAVLASGSDQTVSFTVTSGLDTDTVFIDLLICMARGTLVLCEDGERPVEEIATGDRVWTRDGGLQTVRWVGSRRLGPVELKIRRDLRPVLIRPGALGAGRPDRTLVVSPQHKVLVEDWRAQLFFGEDAVLVAAKALVDDRSILVDHSCTPVEYFHVLFEDHQIIRTNGADTESFCPGATTLNEVDRRTRDELVDLFPELAQDGAGFGAPARPVVRVREARVLRGGVRDA